MLEVTENMIKIGEILQTVGVGIGVVMLVGGIYQLKKYGEMRTMMSHQMSMAGPLMMIVSAAALLSLPAFIHVIMMSLVATASPLEYQGVYGSYMQAVIIFVRVIGVGGFIRGIVMLSKSGHQGQPGTIGKAIGLLIAGVMCIHIMGTVDLLYNILGISI